MTRRIDHRPEPTPLEPPENSRTDTANLEIHHEASLERWIDLLTLRCETVSALRGRLTGSADVAVVRTLLTWLQPGERLSIAMHPRAGVSRTIDWDLELDARAIVGDTRRHFLRQGFAELVQLVVPRYRFGEVTAERNDSASGQFVCRIRPHAWALPTLVRASVGFRPAVQRSPTPESILLALAAKVDRPFDQLIALVASSGQSASVRLVLEPVALTPVDLQRLAGAELALRADSHKGLAHDSLHSGQSVQSPDPDMVGLLRDQIAAWLSGSPCVRILWEIATSDPISEGLLSTLRSIVFPGLPHSPSAHEQSHETETVDFSDCLPLSHLPVNIFPSPEALLDAGAARHFPFHHSPLAESGIVLGTVEDGSTPRRIRFELEDRTRHTYCIGATGTGKTTLMQAMALQDIEDGRGVCVIDPHGTLVAELLRNIPRRRAKDVVVIDPSDAECPVGLNLLDCAGPSRGMQINFAVNELIKILDRLYDLRETGGPLFEQYTRNALLLLMDSEVTGATLIDVPAVFEDEGYRGFLKKHCRNPTVERFWSRQAEAVTGDHSLANLTPYITSKLNQFTTNAVLRPMLGQATPRLQLADVIQDRRIVLVNLSKGLLGELDAQLIGMLLVGKLFTAGLQRMARGTSVPSPFFIYIDEFQNFVTDTVAYMLAEARKFGLALTLANQTLSQLAASRGKQSMLDAVLGNCGSLLCFRVGALDADRLQPYMQPDLSKHDLQDLPAFHIAARLLVRGSPARPFVFKSIPHSGTGPLADSDDLVAYSRATYGQSAAETEARLQRRWGLR